MINTVNMSLFKKKFATLISRLFYGASLSLEQISFKLAYSDAFSSIESNNVKWFMDKQYNELANELFNVSILFESNDVNPVYWASIQYINIFLEKKIPLRQLFVLCPLKEMVAHYEIYHEMNESQLINEFMNNEYKRSILSILVKHYGTSFTKLSFLSDININTLKSYSRTNDMLFKASFENINKIMHCLNINDMALFIKETSFVDMYKILNDEELSKHLSKKIQQYLKIPANIPLQIVNKDYVKGEENAIYIGAFNAIAIDGETKYISDLELLNISKKSL